MKKNSRTGIDTLREYTRELYDRSKLRSLEQLEADFIALMDQWLLLNTAAAAAADVASPSPISCASTSDADEFKEDNPAVAAASPSQTNLDVMASKKLRQMTRHYFDDKNDQSCCPELEEKEDGEGISRSITSHNRPIVSTLHYSQLKAVRQEATMQQGSENNGMTGELLAQQTRHVSFVLACLAGDAQELVSLVPVLDGRREEEEKEIEKDSNRKRRSDKFPASSVFTHEFVSCCRLVVASFASVNSLTGAADLCTELQSISAGEAKLLHEEEEQEKGEGEPTASGSLFSLVVKLCSMVVSGDLVALHLLVSSLLPPKTATKGFSLSCVAGLDYVSSQQRFLLACLVMSLSGHESVWVKAVTVGLEPKAIKHLPAECSDEPQHEEGATRARIPIFVAATRKPS